jgi:bla regulator protein blaR1
VQSLLADRFDLHWHRATRKLPVYELVIANGGPKLKPVSGADFVAAGHQAGSGSWVRSGPGHVSVLGAPLSALTDALSRQLGRTVIDRTGLTGRYDFTLTWTPWRNTGGRMFSGSGYGGAEKPGTATALASDTSGPSIFTAIQQQLGLRLKPARGPVEVLVIDHVEQPSSN